MRLALALLLVGCGSVEPTAISPKYGFRLHASVSGLALSGEEVDARFDAFLGFLGKWNMPDPITLTAPDIYFQDGADWWKDDWYERHSNTISVRWDVRSEKETCEAFKLVHELAHYYAAEVLDDPDSNHDNSLLYMVVYDANNEIGCVPKTYTCPISVCG